jgi:hypothetical protein
LHLGLEPAAVRRAYLSGRPFYWEPTAQRDARACRQLWHTM